MFLNNQQVTEEVKREVKKILETNDNKNTTTQHMRCSESSSKREVYSNTILPQKIRKTLKRQPNFTLKTTGKTTTTTKSVEGNKS